MKTRFLLLSGVVLSLSSCGFEPMYGTTRFNAPTPQQEAIEAKLEQIEIANIPDREGQYMRNALIDRFYRTHRPQETRYLLGVAKLEETKTDLDITKESDATRAELRIDTALTLTDKTTGKAVLVRKLNAVGSYNILTSEFATRVSQDNTRKNIINDLARQIELQIGLYFER